MGGIKMNIQRYRVVAVGAQSPEMLSEITKQLTKYNYEIDSIASLRLGHSFVIVLLIEAIQGKQALANCLQKIVKEYNLSLLIDHCTRKKYEFVKSDAFMRVRGSQMTGVKSYIISQFTEAGLDIHGLESDNYEKNGKDYFVINIKGQAQNGLEDLTAIADKLKQQELDVTIANNYKLLA